MAKARYIVRSRAPGGSASRFTTLNAALRAARLQARKERTQVFVIPFGRGERPRVCRRVGGNVVCHTIRD